MVIKLSLISLMVEEWSHASEEKRPHILVRRSRRRVNLTGNARLVEVPFDPWESTSWATIPLGTGPRYEVISVAFPEFASGEADVFAGSAWPQISKCLLRRCRRVEMDRLVGVDGGMIFWIAKECLLVEHSTWPTYIKI
jgi:hypothetical protein